MKFPRTGRDKIKFILYTSWWLGVALLFIAWEYQKTIPGKMGELLTFIIEAIAYFYPLSLIPLQTLVKENLEG